MGKWPECTYARRKNGRLTWEIFHAKYYVHSVIQKVFIYKINENLYLQNYMEIYFRWQK